MVTTSYARMGTSVPSTSSEGRDAAQFLNQLWQLPRTTGHIPVPNPVSLMRDDILRILREEYYVSAKLDGTRYLLLLGMTEDGSTMYAYAIDRAYHMFKVEDLRVSSERLYEGTLIDGELLRMPSGELRFIGFDIIAMEGIDCTKSNYAQRLVHLERAMTCIASPSCIYLTKRCYPLHSLEQLCEDMQASDAIPSDGLIFMPNRTGILTGMHKTMYKWKSAHTLDFEFRNGLLYYSSVRGPKDSRCLGITLKPNAVLESTQEGAIVECACTLVAPFPCADNNRMPEQLALCTALSVRQDKPTANFERTVQLTLRNIRENITRQEIMERVSMQRDSQG